MLNTIFDETYNIDTQGFIGGTDKELTFIVYGKNSTTAKNLIGTTIYWYLSPYGSYSKNILEYSTEDVSPNGRIVLSATEGMFTLYIPYNDTLSLSGKYIQQISITDYLGKTFRAGQGDLIISPAIQIT